jgi:hypothetical protein
MKNCPCSFCLEPERPMYSYPDAALLWLVQTGDEHHRRRRVNGYIELFYRAGVFHPLMAYWVWLCVMGTEVDPPFAQKGISPPGSLGELGIGAFQTGRAADGRVLDGQWPWWDAVDRRMPWNESLPDGATLVREHLLAEKLDYEEWVFKKRKRTAPIFRRGLGQRYTLN